MRPEHPAGHCPVCAHEARAVMMLRQADIRAGLGENMGAAVPEGLVLADYVMARCESCDLVFADPMRAGDADFYRWITGFPQYHADARWEWEAMRRIVAARRSVRLLDVGCGDGKFLVSLAGLSSVDASGIDFGEDNVVRARAKGLAARRVSLEDLAQEGARFDVITLSHVLEHVAAPLGVVSLAKSLLRPGGEIILSVPYSPTSGETLRPDIMNLPPHHLTRWNMRSLRRLAEMAGLEFGYEMRKPKSIVKRAIRHIRDQGYPYTFVRTLALYRAREKVDGRRAADEILVRLGLR